MRILHCLADLCKTISKGELFLSALDRIRDISGKTEILWAKQTLTGQIWDKEMYAKCQKHYTSVNERSYDHIAQGILWSLWKTWDLRTFLFVERDNKQKTTLATDTIQGQRKTNIIILGGHLWKLIGQNIHFCIPITEQKWNKHYCIK